MYPSSTVMAASVGHASRPSRAAAPRTFSAIRGTIRSAGCCTLIPTTWYGSPSSAAPSTSPACVVPEPVPRKRWLGWRSRSPSCRASSAEARSEEHTSELQSHVNLVCRLLLEKKKLVSLSLRGSVRGHSTPSDDHIFLLHFDVV